MLRDTCVPEVPCSIYSAARSAHNCSIHGMLTHMFLPTAAPFERLLLPLSEAPTSSQQHQAPEHTKPLSILPCIHAQHNM